MDFRELEYIITIANTGNITRAADALYIAQPTLSRFLQVHEKLLGTKLFHRVKGKLVPTYSGERYLEHARQIMNIRTQMEQELNDISCQQKGRLNIACPRHRRDGIILLSVMKFKKLYPNIEINLLELDTSKRMTALLNGDADIAIVFAPAHPDPAVTFEPLLKEELVLCVPPDHPLAKTGDMRPGIKYPYINIKDFEQDNFILQPPTSTSGQIVEQIFKKYNFSPNVVLCTTSLHGTLETVKQGFACAFIPDSYALLTPLSPSPVFFSLGDPCTNIILNIAYNTNTYHPKYMLSYLEFLKKEVADLFHN